MSLKYQMQSLLLMSLAATSTWLHAEEWPKVVENGGQELTIYQPQVDHWKDNRLEEHAAVSVRTAESNQPVFGVFWLSARTDVDKAERVVTLEDIQIQKVSFPSQPESADSYRALIAGSGAQALRTISLDRLRASLAIAEIETQRKRTDFRNDPPAIFYSDKPSILVLIDGPSTLRETPVENMQRVINTRALILFNQSEGIYYLSVANHWVSASSPRGPWTDAHPSETTLTRLEKTKSILAQDKQVDLLNDPENEFVKSDQIPHVFTSTESAELIQTGGRAQMEPITGTSLLYVKNTSNNIFMNTLDQNYYVTLSGRWFRAKNLDGNWNYVSANELPADFAKIPETHPKGEILASVPGTPDAREAQISNEIPQTATVDRNEAKLTVVYDGHPNFVEISGTPLLYAPNSATPVIRVNDYTYYAVEHGVWFTAMSPEGPWSVASSVPSVIYSIPPSSPIYPVTYVYVYEATPRYVYVGYLPGYLGSYVTSEGVVVYGTGYRYHPWVHHVWYGCPTTYGFGIAWGYGFGFGFHAAHYSPPLYHPWWGPWREWHRETTVNQVVNVNHVNIYRNWGDHVVQRPMPVHFPVSTMPIARGPVRTIQPVPRNNVFADRQGNVFRHNENTGWEHYHDNRSWRNVSVPQTQQMQAPQPHLPSTSFAHVTQNLERDRVARERGASFSQRYSSQPTPTPSTPRRSSLPSRAVAPPHVEPPRHAPPQPRFGGDSRSERTGGSFRR